LIAIIHGYVTENHGVGGSIPPLGTKINTCGVGQALLSSRLARQPFERVALAHHDAVPIAARRLAEQARGRVPRAVVAVGARVQ
jgi:hypothetical protein